MNRVQKSQLRPSLISTMRNVEFQEEISSKSPLLSDRPKLATKYPFLYTISWRKKIRFFNKKRQKQRQEKNHALRYGEEK